MEVKSSRTGVIVADHIVVDKIIDIIIIVVAEIRYRDFQRHRLLLMSERSSLWMR